MGGNLWNFSGNLLHPASSYNSDLWTQVRRNNLWLPLHQRHVLCSIGGSFEQVPLVKRQLDGLLPPTCWIWRCSSPRHLLLPKGPRSASTSYSCKRWRESSGVPDQKSDDLLDQKSDDLIQEVGTCLRTALDQIREMVDTLPICFLL